MVYDRAFEELMLTTTDRLLKTKHAEQLRGKPYWLQAEFQAAGYEGKGCQVVRVYFPEWFEKTSVPPLWSGFGASTDEDSSGFLDPAKGWADEIAWRVEDMVNTILDTPPEGELLDKTEALKRHADGTHSGKHCTCSSECPTDCHGECDRVRDGANENCQCQACCQRFIDVFNAVESEGIHEDAEVDRRILAMIPG